MQVPTIQNDSLRKESVIGSVAPLLHLAQPFLAHRQFAQLPSDGVFGIRSQDPPDAMLADPTRNSRVGRPIEQNRDGPPYRVVALLAQPPVETLPVIVIDPL